MKKPPTDDGGTNLLAVEIVGGEGCGLRLKKELIALMHQAAKGDDIDLDVAKLKIWIIEHGQSKTGNRV